MHYTRKLLAFFCVALLVGEFVGFARAQTAAATINSTVVDSTRADIPGAQITITNQGTAAKVETTTTADGSFSMTGLATGTYQVSVVKAGFQTYTEKDLYVGPATIRTVNAALSVSQVSSQVTVEAAAVQVQTTAAQFSNNVAQQQVETLCLSTGAVTRAFPHLCRASPI